MKVARETRSNRGKKNGFFSYRQITFYQIRWNEIQSNTYIVQFLTRFCPHEIIEYQILSNLRNYFSEVSLLWKKTTKRVSWINDFSKFQIFQSQIWPLKNPDNRGLSVTDELRILKQHTPHAHHQYWPRDPGVSTAGLAVQLCMYLDIFHHNVC